MTPKLTPMLQQYMEAKSAHPDAILLFRMGDFYEVFFEDAHTCARELDVTLTARGRDRGEPIPMAGVPHHAIDGYVRRLVEKGYRVAFCDQLESPDTAKGIVRRGVTRVITPGVRLDDVGLDARAPNYLAAIAVSSLKAADVAALAFVDVSTGELRVTELQSFAALADEVQRIAPSEIIVARSQRALLASALTGGARAITERGDDALVLKRVIDRVDSSSLAVGDHATGASTLSPRELTERLAVLDRNSFRDRDAINSALALILEYLCATQGGVPATLSEPEVVRTDDFLVLDPATTANLELFETLMGARKQGSLFSVIDQTVTAPGARRLRTWLAYPLKDIARIEARQEAVSSLVAGNEVREAVRQALRHTSDVQRICGKLAAGQGGPRDLVTLRFTLERIPELRQRLADFDSPLLQRVLANLDPCDDVVEAVATALVDEPPVDLDDGGVIRPGFNNELDQLVELSTDAKRWILRYEQQEKDRSRISSLKVRHNRVFGYYIEVTKANVESVPSDYIRRQTIANGERYITPELKEFEEKVLTADERRLSLESDLYDEVRRLVVGALGRLRRTAEHLAELDAIAALAELSQKRDYTAPVMRAERGIRIRDGRHPVVETMVEGGRFVPNDVELGDDRTLTLITGPNMAGKSTVIRQAALIVLLAQIGSHVPASSAEIGVVDQIFSRVGASDNLARGQSTFMVEMSETAHILRRATDRSLVILDEIGRGTSTFDGLAIAWAVAEHLHDALGSLALFATHYHELTELVRFKQRAHNANIAVREWNEEIIFLHRLVDGPANRSYGIQVARIAGVPDAVVKRAREVLANLESVQGGDEPVIGLPNRDGLPQRRPANQLSLFGDPSPAEPVRTAPAESALVDELLRIPLDATTPLDAHRLLERLQKKARARRS